MTSAPPRHLRPDPSGQRPHDSAVGVKLNSPGEHVLQVSPEAPVTSPGSSSSSNISKKPSFIDICWAACITYRLFGNGPALKVGGGGDRLLWADVHACPGG